MKNPAGNHRCPNCSAPLSGDENYCSHCGQKLPVKRLDLKDIARNFFDKIFAFDAPWFKSVVNLLYRPAFVASNYIEGQRKTFSSPIGLLVSLSVVYLTLVKLDGDNTNAVKASVKTPEIQTAISGIFERNADFGRLYDSHLPVPVQDSLVELLMEEVHQTLIEEEEPDKGLKIKKEISGDASLLTLYSVEKYFKAHNIPYQGRYLNTLRREIFSRSPLENIPEFIILLSTEGLMYQPVDSVIKQLRVPESHTAGMIFGYNLAKLINDRSYRKSFVNKLYGQITWTLLIFLPVFALFLRILYRKLPYNYVEILSFVFYLQSAFLAGLIILFVTDKLLPFDITWILPLWFLVLLDVNWRKFFGGGVFAGRLKLYLLVVPLYFILAGLSLLSVTVISLL